MSAAGDRATSRSGVRTGRVLSEKYRLLGKLGEGGMGEVYAAEHTFVGRRFAVKFLHKELARDEQIMARFRREAQAAGSLENENIVAVTDFGYADDGAPFIVMEYLAGEDLRSLLSRSGRLTIKRAVELVIQACRGLHAAHARYIVHRDLKPENLFITKRGDGSDLLKVLDFGIAKLRGKALSGASTRAGTVIGTLLYMPPEQVRGDKDTDHRADIYALGAILYEALSGSVPHPGDEPHGIMFHILYQPPTPLGSLRPDLPPDLVSVVHRALAVEPADRFESVAALSEALAAFSGRQVTPLEGATMQHSATLPSGPPLPVERRTTSETQRAMRAAGLSPTARSGRRTLLWVVVAVLLAAAAFALLLPRDATPVVHVVKPLLVPAAVNAAGPSSTNAPRPSAAPTESPVAAEPRLPLAPEPTAAPPPTVEPAPERQPRATRRATTIPRTGTAASAPVAEPPLVEPATLPVPAPPPSPPPKPSNRLQVRRDNPYD